MRKDEVTLLFGIAPHEMNSVTSAIQAAYLETACDVLMELKDSELRDKVLDHLWLSLQYAKQAKRTERVLP